MGAGILGSRSIIFRPGGPVAPVVGLGTEWAHLLLSSPHNTVGGGLASDTVNQDEDGWIEAQVQHSTTGTARNAPRSGMLKIGWALEDPVNPNAVLNFYNPDGNYNGVYDAELVIELDGNAPPDGSEQATLFVGWCLDAQSLDENTVYNYQFAGWQYGASWTLKSFRSTNGGETTTSTAIANTLSPHLHLRAGSSFRCIMVAPLASVTMDYNGSNNITPIVLPGQAFPGADQFCIALGSNKTSQPAATTYTIRFRPWWRLTYRPRVDLTRPADD